MSDHERLVMSTCREELDFQLRPAKAYQGGVDAAVKHEGEPIPSADVQFERF